MRMKHTEETIAIKERMRNLWLGGETNPEVLAAKAGRALGTVYRWITEWKKKYPDEIKLEEKIKGNVAKALNVALEEFIKKPTEGLALQSLASLLKQYMQRYEPSKELNNHIIIFLDQLISYCIDTNNEELRTLLQPEIEDMAEYLRRKNNG